MQWLAEICIKRPVFATMLVMSVVVVGAFAFLQLGIDRLPSFDIPSITVTVSNPGAAPQEIETEITQRLEDQINTISGLDTLTSTSSEGQSQVIAQFDLDKDIDTAAQDVRDKVNLVVGLLPTTAEDPIIQKLDISAQPILQIAISGEMSQSDLYTLVDNQVSDRLVNVPGVSDVRLVGGGQREIQISLNPERMKAYAVTATDVTSALQRQNQESPGGRLTQGANEITVRTLGKVQSVKDFGAIPIIQRANYTVLLNDIAEVTDGTVEARSIALLNGVNALTLQIMKQPGGNTATVASNVKERLAEIQKSLGDRVQITTVYDESTFIRASVSTVEEHLVIGSILACLVVLVFLGNFRMTVIAALAIPTSIIGTFAVMWALDYTLNMITMLSLTLMIGIVIDDAIIVLENIYHFMEKGYSAFEASVKGTAEVGLAVLATTLSLLAVFVPVGFMSGMVGRFMGSFGLTSAAAIAISLFISFTLTPMLCSRFIKAKHKKEAEEVAPVDEAVDDETEADVRPPSFIQKLRSIDFFKPIVDLYVRLLQWSMNHRWAIVVICAVVLFSNVLLVQLVGIEFVPVDDESAFRVTVEAPEGTTLAAMTTVTERIAKDLRALPGVTDTLATVGGGGTAATSSVNNASIFVKLTPIEDREFSQQELTTKAREILNQYPSELKTTSRSASGFSGNYAVQYVLRGPEVERLAAYADEIVKQLKQDPNAIDVDSSLSNTKRELRVTVDRQRAADLGVSVQDVSQAINILLTGSVATTFNTGGDQYDVRVRASGIFRQRTDELKQMSVRSDKNEIIPLDQLVKIEDGVASASIERYNRQRQVTIYSNVRDGASTSDVSNNLTKIVESMNLDPAYETTTAGSSKNMADSLNSFLLAFAMSFIFMYMILAAQFESFIHPVTILLTLPLAIPFGLLSLILTGQSLNLFSLLGILVLFGIVKKNAILQIDHTNQLRERGMNRYDAIIQANRDRLRPILMTTIAFVAGMIPLVLTTGAGASTNRSIGTLVAGGQTFCLVLTLLAVPVFYSIWDDWGQLPIFGRIAARWRLFKHNLKQRFRSEKPHVEPATEGTTTTASILLIGILALASATYAQEKQDSTENMAKAVNVEKNQIASDDISSAESRIIAEGSKAEKSAAKKAAGGSSSDTGANPTAVPASNLTRLGVQTVDPLALTLQDAIRLALQQNNDIKASETDVRIAEFALRGARGAYDPSFTSENYFERSTAPSASSLTGTRPVTETAFSTVTGVSGRVPRFGGSYSAQLSTSRIGSTSPFNTLNPQYPASFSMEYRQPLWRGLRIDETRRSIEVAKKNVSLSDAQFRQRVVETISNIETAYWNLAYAVRNLQVQQSAVKDAQAQLDSNKRQVDEGVLAPVDIVQAQSQLATLQQNVFTAKEQVTGYENTLKALVLPNREDANWSRPITPTSEVSIEIPRVSLSDAIESALKNRPELTQLQTSKEINQINTRYYRDATKPQIDLVAGYTTQGLAGTSLSGGTNPFANTALTNRVNELSILAGLQPLPTTTPTPVGSGLNGGLFKSLGGLLSQDYPTYRAGVSISLPILNRTAKANLGSSLAEGTKLEYQIAQQRQNVESEVRTALEAVNAAEQRNKLATQVRELATTLYESERRQAIAGTSTIYLVLQRQTDLVQAQAAELQAQTDLNRTISNLHRAIGSSLDSNGVKLQTDPR